MPDEDRVIAPDDVARWAADRFADDSLVAEIVETPWGFTVTVQSREFLETGDLLSMLIGHGPYIVDGRSGEVWATGSAPQQRSGDAGAPGWADLVDQASFDTWMHERRPGVGNVLDANDPDHAGERLIQRYARSRGMTLPYADGGELGWSDFEVGRLIRPTHDDCWAFTTSQRGVREEVAVFSQRDDALRALLVDLARMGFRRRYTARHPAADVTERDVDGRIIVQWDGREAEFRGPRARDEFLPFARASLEDIAASFESPSGVPLLRFDE